MRLWSSLHWEKKRLDRFEEQNMAEFSMVVFDEHINVYCGPTAMRLFTTTVRRLQFASELWTPNANGQHSGFCVLILMLRWSRWGLHETCTISANIFFLLMYCLRWNISRTINPSWIYTHWFFAITKVDI